jgi:gas vesicle protein
LLDGLFGSIIGGVVAVVAAFLAVRLTSKANRRDALMSETRQGVLRLYLTVEEARRLAVDDSMTITEDVIRRVIGEMSSTRVLLATKADSIDPDKPFKNSEELRVHVTRFVVGLRERRSGEPPAVVIQPFGILRNYLIDLLRSIRV